MPQPRKVSDEGLAEIEEVALIRHRLPSDKQLAQKNNISVIRVEQLMRQARMKLLNPIGSTWSDVGVDSNLDRRES